jgi:hypothetical protein
MAAFDNVPKGDELGPLLLAVTIAASRAAVGASAQTHEERRADKTVKALVGR